MYGLEVSTAEISLITDKLLPTITQWHNCPLESVYPIVFLDAMHFKVRVEEGKCKGQFKNDTVLSKTAIEF